MKSDGSTDLGLLSMPMVAEDVEGLAAGSREGDHNMCEDDWVLLISRMKQSESRFGFTTVQERTTPAFVYSTVR